MSKKKKNNFANAIIMFVLIITTVICAFVLYEYHRLDEVLPSGVLSVLFGFYGGELLIIALRQVFGSDVIKNAKITHTESEGSI